MCATSDVDKNFEIALRQSPQGNEWADNILGPLLAAIGGENAASNYTEIAVGGSEGIARNRQRVKQDSMYSVSFSHSATTQPLGLPNERRYIIFKFHL